MKLYPYSYFLNNPLKYTDPSGYVYEFDWAEWEKEHVAEPGGGTGGNEGWGLSALDAISTAVTTRANNPYLWSYDEHTETYINRLTGEVIDASDPDALDKMGIPHFSTNSKALAVAYNTLWDLGIDPIKYLSAVAKEIEAARDADAEAFLNNALASLSSTGGLSFDGDPEKTSCDKGSKYMAGALVISGILLADDASGVLVIDDIFIPFLIGGAYVLDKIFLTERVDEFPTGPLYTDRPKNYIPPPVPDWNNRDYFPNGNGNELAKWIVRAGGAAVLGRRLYEGFRIDTTSLFPANDNTYVSPFLTPIPEE